MRVVMTGATGFVGRALTRSLVADGHEVVVLSRSAAGRRPSAGVIYAPFDGRTGQGWSQLLDGADVLVNLAGESIASGYWTKARKRRIAQSRINAGQACLDALGRVFRPPSVLIQCSATGYYGDRGDVPADETTPAGCGFLAEVATRWEASTEPAEAMGLRRCIVRLAVVLGADGGALPGMLRPYRWCAGGPLGNGRQYFPWIHIHDVVSAIRFLIDDQTASGPFNLVAPGAVDHNGLATALGRALKRPALLRVPAPVLRLLLGEMARELLLTGVLAVPRRLAALGFSFRYQTIDEALDAVLAGKAGSDA